MPTLLERRWPKLALLLTLALFAGLFFVPALAHGFAMPLIAFMLGMGLLLLALRHWQAYRAGKLSRRELARNIFIETASLLLAACALWVVALAWFAGGLVAGFVQEDYGWLLGLLSAILVGAAAGPSIRLRHSGQVWLSTRRWGVGSRAGRHSANEMPRSAHLTTRPLLSLLFQLPEHLHLAYAKTKISSTGCVFHLVLFVYDNTCLFAVGAFVPCRNPRAGNLP